MAGDSAKDMASYGQDNPYGNFRTGSQVYSPYGLGGFDPAMIDQINLPATPDYLFASSATKRRSFSELVFFGTGSAYIVGQTIGGSWGLVEGLRHPEGTSSRLRINCILNACTKRGPYVANSFAALAFLYNSIDGGAGMLRGGDDDSINSIVAGGLTGLLFKSTAGVKKMGIASAFGAAVAGCYVFGKHFLHFDGRPSNTTQSYSTLTS